MKRSLAIAALLSLLTAYPALAVTTTVLPSAVGSIDDDPINTGSTVNSTLGVTGYTNRVETTDNTGQSIVETRHYVEFDLGSIAGTYTPGSATLHFSVFQDPDTFGNTGFSIFIDSYDDTSQGSADNLIAGAFTTPDDFGAGFVNGTNFSTTVSSGVASGSVNFALTIPDLAITNALAAGIGVLGIEFTADTASDPGGDGITVDIFGRTDGATAGDGSALGGHGSAVLEIEFAAPNTPPIAILQPVAPFSAGSAATLLDGSASSDAEDGFALANWDYDVAGGVNINPGAATENLTLAQSGLMFTTDTTTVELEVTDQGNATNSNPNPVETIAYSNANPTIAANSAGGPFTAAGGSISTDIDISDPDFTYNSGGNQIAPDFEQISYTIDLVGAGGSVPIDSGVDVTSDVNDPSISFSEFIQAIGAAGTTQSTATININVDDRASNDPGPNAGQEAGASDNSLVVAYDNVSAPSSSLAENLVVSGRQFQATISDADLDLNGDDLGGGVNVPSQFELVDFEWLLTGPGGSVDITGVPNDTGSVDDSATEPIIEFSDIFLSGLSPGDYTLFFNTTDRAGNQGTNSIMFNIAAIPEPATIAIWSLLGMCFAGYYWRRKKA